MGEPEGKSFYERLNESARLRRLKPIGLVLPCERAHFAKRDLLRNEFVELEPLPVRVRAVDERFRVGVGRRIMEVFERGSEAGEVKLIRERGRDGILHPLHVEKRSGDALSQPLLLNAFTQGVDGGERFRKRDAARYGLTDFGMNHLEAAPEGGARFAVDAHDRAGAQGRLRPGEVVNEAERKYARFILEERNQLLSPGRRGHLRANDFALHLCGFARDKHSDGVDLRFVLIAQRQMKNEIPVGDESELFEPFVQRCELSGADDAGSFLGRALNLIHCPKTRGSGGKINDRLDLNEGALRERSDSKARTGRIGGFKEFAHDAVDDGKVVDRGEEDCELHDLRGRTAGFGNDGFKIAEGLTGLSLNAVLEFSRIRANADLTGTVERRVRCGRLTVVAECGRSFLSGNNAFGHD